jgi:HK97 family phage major capsid protein
LSWIQIKRLKEERAQARTDLQAVLTKSETEKRDLTGEESAAFDQHEKRVNDLTTQIDRYERASGVDRTIDGTHPGRGPIEGQDEHRTQEDPTITRALRRDESASDYIRNRTGQASRGSEIRSTARLMQIMAGAKASGDERRALAEGSDSTGGVTVPVELAGNFIYVLRPRIRCAQAGMQVVPLTSKTNNIARLTGDIAVAWRAENAAAAETTDPAFDKVTLTPKSLAGILRVSRELLMDSINVEDMINASLGGAMGVEVDRAALLGTGAANQPTGLTNIVGVTALSQGVNGAAITSFSPLLDARETLLGANASEPTAAILATRTDRAIAGFADSTGQPLMRPKAIENLPLLATTAVPVNEAHGTAVNASRIYLGNFAEMFLGVHVDAGIRIEILRERFADALQVGFLVSMRADIAVAHAASFAMITGIIP